jgi:2-isopropylmalate synthase
MTQIQLYDTTLRDGAGSEGISLSVEDKLKITRKLDELGIHVIEGGFPGSNPKEVEYFQRVRGLTLRNARVAAFGSTRRANAPCEGDPFLTPLIESGMPVVTIVGKAWDLQVTEILRTTLDENLAMIADSVRYLKQHGLTVVYDAEHFFDGFRANPAYATRCVEVAAEAGVDVVALCDTNGGSLPHQVAEAIQRLRDRTVASLGIHAHNDSEVAVANSLTAVQAGVRQVQGCINGYGERTGNANLCSVIPNLQLKMGYQCLEGDQLAHLFAASHYISEVANFVPNAHMPYVGVSAFTHKAGLHADAELKLAGSYQHIAPELVGNQRRVLVSELSGRKTILYKIQERGLEVEMESDQAKELVEQIKLLESQGFQFDGAEASFDLLVYRSQPDYRPPFELVDFLTIVEKRRRPASFFGDDEILTEATLKVRINGELYHTVSEGNGPINALDGALRKALTPLHPEIAAIHLIDYKVRVLEATEGTAAHIRVLIESTDGEEQWSTVGSSTNVIEASWLALADSFEYYLARLAARSRAAAASLTSV